MEYYYKDITEPDGSWAGLGINIVQTSLRKFYFQASHGYRFRLLTNKKPILWARMDDWNYDYNYIKSFEAWELDEMPVGIIKSPEIEKAKGLSGEDHYKYWTRLFLEKLVNAQSHLFHEGFWYMGFYKGREDWFYQNIKPDWRYDDGTIHQVDQCLHNLVIQNTDFINRLITLKELPEDSDGRVKWWRKKIREGSLPPVLVMYSTLFHSYLVIDGHSRLMASKLENLPPEIIVLYSMQEERIELAIEDQQKVSRALEKAKGNKNPISIDKMNEVLIQVFDDRPYTRKICKTIAVKDEGKWEEEVTKRVLEVGTQEDLNYFIDRWRM